MLLSCLYPNSIQGTNVWSHRWFTFKMKKLLSFSDVNQNEENVEMKIACLIEADLSRCK